MSHLQISEGAHKTTLVCYVFILDLSVIKNKFYYEIEDLYKTNPSNEELKELLGRARAKKGIYEGDLIQGELEIGQIAGIINEVKSSKDILEEIISDFESTKKLFK